MAGVVLNHLNADEEADPTPARPGLWSGPQETRSRCRHTAATLLMEHGVVQSMGCTRVTATERYTRRAPPKDASDRMGAAL